MKESETLFYLVASLTKNEKRNFILDVRREKSSAGEGYLALYKWYEKQKVSANPSETELRKSGLTPNRLAVQKHYLVHRILDSLMAHSTGLSEEAKVRLLINKSELLLAKGMTGASLRLLDTAERLATACFSYQLQLDILLRREAHVQQYADVQLVQQLEAKKRSLLVIIGNINDYQQLSYKIFAFTRRHDFVSTEQQRKSLNRICAHPLLRNEKRALSPIAKFHMYHTLCHYASLTQDPLQSLNYGHRHLEIFDEEPEATRHELDYYITLLFNISIVTIYFGDAAGISRTIKRWEELPENFSKSMTPQREKKWQFNNMEMVVRRNLFAGRFDEVIRLLPRITQMARIPHPYAPVFHESILFSVAFVLHAEGNSRQALRWLTPIITDEKVEYRRYRLLLKAFLLRIIIHFDLDRHDIAETLFKQLKSFLQRHARKTELETIMVATFESLLKTTQGKAQREVMRKAAQDFSDTFCRPGHWFTAYDNINLYAWFRAKEMRRGLREILPEALETFRKKARASFREKNK
jgi:hypothetical protein